MSDKDSDGSIMNMTDRKTDRQDLFKNINTKFSKRDSVLIFVQYFLITRRFAINTSRVSIPLGQSVGSYVGDLKNFGVLGPTLLV